MLYSSDAAIFGSFFAHDYRDIAHKVMRAKHHSPEDRAESLSNYIMSKQTNLSHPATVAAWLDFLDQICTKHTKVLVLDVLSEYQAIVKDGLSLADHLISLQSYKYWLTRLIKAILSAMQQKGVSKLFLFANRSRISLAGDNVLADLTRQRIQNSDLEACGLSATPASDNVSADAACRRSRDSDLDATVVQATPVSDDVTVDLVGRSDTHVLNTSVLQAIPAIDNVFADMERQRTQITESDTSAVRPMPTTQSQEIEAEIDTTWFPMTPTSMPASPSPGRAKASLESASTDPDHDDSGPNREDAANSDDLNNPTDPPPYNPHESDARFPDILQVYLKGPDLRSAWLAHEFTRHLSHPGAHFDPQEPTGLSIYHALNPQERPHVTVVTLRYGAQVAMGNPRNDLIPQPILETSFFAIREILMAVFDTAMGTIGLMPDRPSLLSQPFDVDGTQYYGILLFETNYNTPSAATSISTVRIGENVIDRWSSAARTHACTPANIFWAREDIRAFGASGQAPDVIHAPERHDVRRRFQHWIGPKLCRNPIWRTGHATQNAQAVLASRPTVVYAVAYTQDAVVSGNAKTRSQKAFVAWKPKTWIRSLRRPRE